MTQTVIHFGKGHLRLDSLETSNIKYICDIKPALGAGRGLMLSFWFIMHPPGVVRRWGIYWLLMSVNGSKGLSNNREGKVTIDCAISTGECVYRRPCLLCCWYWWWCVCDADLIVAYQTLWSLWLIELPGRCTTLCTLYLFVCGWRLYWSRDSMCLHWWICCILGFVHDYFLMFSF